MNCKYDSDGWCHCTDGRTFCGCKKEKFTNREWCPREKFELDELCPKCHGEVGHRINCPDGIASSKKG
jgi:hypothetical protein